jgi:hypothetical protein
MVLIVNSNKVGLYKTNTNIKPLTNKTPNNPNLSKFEKNIEKKIQGDGFKELTDKLRNMSVKDSMKNIRISF